MLKKETDLTLWRRARYERLMDRLSAESWDAVRKGVDTLSRLNFSVDAQEITSVAKSLSQSQDILPRHRDDFARIAYIAHRTEQQAWNGLLSHVRQHSPRHERAHQTSFSIPQAPQTIIPRKIRQCRPNIRSYSVSNIQQIGLYNQNREFDYNNYDFDAAMAYLEKNLGRFAGRLFTELGVPQVQSDFFLVAALYYEGGVSADVCTVNRASIGALLGEDRTFGCVVNSFGVEKKFLFATARHPFVKAYFEHLTVLAERIVTGDSEFEYDSFSGPAAFLRFMLDDFCEENPTLDLAKASFIESEIYDAFIDPSLEEEGQSLDALQSPFQRVRLVGFADDLKYGDGRSSSMRGEAIIASVPAHFMPRADRMTVVGLNKIPDFLRQATVPYAHPAVHLFQAHNLLLSGHGGLWKDGKFLRLDSYLSWVSEDEFLNGHWLTPTSGVAPRIIDEPVITTFGAGYGCYGHWLVDDLPRLALARDLLGEAAFLSRKVILPEKTPTWGIRLLIEVMKLPEENIIFFDHESEIVQLRDVIVPSYLSRHYRFHPIIRDYFSSLTPEVERPWRRICFSRRAWEVHKANQRIFKQQDYFEALASQRGFEIIRPEELSFEAQVQLLAETRCQVGEHGSAQHASVFNRHGMTVGTINPLTEVQTNLGRVFGDSNVVVYEDASYRDGSNNYFYEMREEKIVAFFDEVERVDASRATH